MKAFEWTDECQRAFEELKAYLASPPLFNLSKPNEELSLYLVISPTVVSLPLIQQVPMLQQDLMAKHYKRKSTGTCSSSKTKSYLLDGLTTKNAHRHLILIPTEWIDNQECPWAPNSHPYGMDQQPRMPMGT